MGIGLQVQRLVVRKSGYTLLKGVNITVAPGEFVALVGPNGAGKTTLLRAILGEQPYSGTVIVRKGQDQYNLYQDPERWFREIGWVPADNVLHDSLPVKVALTFAGQLRGILPKQLEDQINKWLMAFGVAHKQNALLSQLSSGERKRVNICAELLAEPELLLLDEPTTNLDPYAESALMETLARLSREGKTVIVVTHTTGSLHYCSRIHFMGRAEVIGTMVPIGADAVAERGPQGTLDWQWYREVDTPGIPVSARLDQQGYEDLLSRLFEVYQTAQLRPSASPRRECSPRSPTPMNLAEDTETTWPHYLLVCYRQIRLFLYEGWRIPVRETWERLRAFVRGLQVSVLGKAVLYGQVRDSQTGQPIAGAKVEVGAGRSTTTLIDGTYQLAIWVTGTYSVTLSAAGYRSQRREVDLTSDWHEAKFDLERDVAVPAHMQVVAQPEAPLSFKVRFLDRNFVLPLPFLLAIALGPLAGLLLSLVLPDGAFLRSEGNSISTDAGDVSQAAFLVGLVAFLLGLIGSFRSVVNEIHIYSHERLKGLNVKSYLLAKVTVFGALYGLVAPLAMFLILFYLSRSQLFPSMALVGGVQFDILFSLILTSLTGVAVGLAVSCVGSRGELATLLVAAIVIFNALLSGLVSNDAWREWIDRLSIAVPSRWALEALQTTTLLYCWGVRSNPRDQFSPAHMFAVWFALLTCVLVSVAVSYLALHLKDTWFSFWQRLRRLFSRGNYIYIVIALISLFSSLTLYKLVQQAHADKLVLPQVQEHKGIQAVLDRFSASRCPVVQDFGELGEAQEPSPSPTPTEGSETGPGVVPTVMATATAGIPATTTPRPAIATAIATLTPRPTSRPTAEPSPTLQTDLIVTVPYAVDVYYSPNTMYPKIVSLPPNIQLTLLSYETRAGVPWVRVQTTDSPGQDYVGWVEASSPPLSGHLIGQEGKPPPDCARPIASVSQKIQGVDISTGKLGSWVSDGTGDVVAVVDLYRMMAGSPSEEMILHLQVNGKEVRTVPIRSQKKTSLLQNGVYNVQINVGDTLSLFLTPSSSATLRSLHGFVTIFAVPKDCEFEE